MKSNTQQLTGRFSLRTLCLAVGSFALAFALLTWSSIRPFAVPLAIAVPLYWCGALCMSLGARRLQDYHTLALLGSVLLSLAVLTAVLGPLFVLVLWLLSLIH